MESHAAQPPTTPNSHPSPDREASGALAQTYAEALIELADDGGSLDAIADEVESLRELLRDEPSLRAILENPAIGDDERRGALERMFKGRVSDTLYRFIQVVNNKGRSGVLPSILAAFTGLVRERRGIVEVDAFVPQRMEAGEADRVQRRVGERLGKEVVLHQYVDPSVIGGIKLRIGDRMIDGTVRAQLGRMRARLAEVGRGRGVEAERGQGAEGSRGPEDEEALVQGEQRVER